jgi:sRNA-binding regulator protein Hfq
VLKDQCFIRLLAYILICAIKKYYVFYVLVEKINKQQAIYVHVCSRVLIMYENKIYKLANCRLVQMRLHIHMSLHVRSCIVSVYTREINLDLVRIIYYCL